MRFDARKSNLVRATYTIETLYSSKKAADQHLLALCSPLRKKLPVKTAFSKGKNVEKLFREEVIYDYSVIV